MKQPNLFWGLVLILAAFLLLLKQLNIIENFFAYLWLTVLLLTGIWLILSALLSRQREERHTFQVNLPQVAQAEVSLEYATGSLNVHGEAPAGQLLSGWSTFPILLKAVTNQDVYQVSLKRAPELWTWSPGEVQKWDVALASQIPLKIYLKSGVANTHLDLRSLQVRELHLETAASVNEIYLPVNAGQTNVRIQAGAATIRIHLPKSIAAQIQLEHELSNLNIADRFQKVNKNLYLTPNHAEAAHRIDITIQSALATVEILDEE